MTNTRRHRTAISARICTIAFLIFVITLFGFFIHAVESPHEIRDNVSTKGNENLIKYSVTQYNKMVTKLL